MELGKVLEHLTWPLIVLILAVFAIIIFKNQLRALLQNTKAFRLKTEKHEFNIKFRQQVQKAEAKAHKIERSVTDTGVRPSAEKAVDYSKHSSRELVLRSWEALKTTVYSACAAMQIPQTPYTDMTIAVQRLLEVHAIDEEMLFLLNTLGVLGQELAHDKDLTPIDNDAKQYKRLADIAMDWMILSIIGPRKPVQSDSAVEGHGRPTVFSRPLPGSPTAALIGIAGAVEGRQYSVDRMEYGIGSASDNELSISDDDYVSGHHASLHFADGSLYIRDQNSKNGTFVNERRVTQSAVSIQPGDRIRMGDSILQVVKT